MHRKRGLLLISAAAALLVLLLSCTFDYETAARAASREIPDFILTNASYTVARSGERAMMFEADTVSMYSSSQTAVLAAVSMYQKDDDSGTSGTCSEARINTDSLDAVLTGSVALVSEREGVRLEAERLEWDNSSGELFSGPDDLVLAVYEDGSRVLGRGFSGDLDLNVFEFQEILEGTLHYEKE
jgi:LPS export ABC transporter protein LptC